MLTRLFLIRHGRTAWNKQKRYCGRLDVGLSPEGRQQAKKLKAQLKDICFDRIYCSTQKRARQTARIIFKGFRFTAVSALREIDFGVLEGMHYKDIMLKYGAIYAGWIKDPYRSRIPGSEPIGSFKKRVVSSLQKIIRKNQGKTIAVVCHGGVIGVFMSSLKKSRNFWPYVPKSTSVSVIEYRKRKPRIARFNDTKHLEG